MLVSTVFMVRYFQFIYGYFKLIYCMPFVVAITYNCSYLYLFTAVEKKVDILSDDYLKANVARRIATEWENVGLYLEIDSDDLSTIKGLRNPSQDKCREMLRAWLKRGQIDVSKSPIYKNMYEAMKALAMIRPAEILIDELIEKYPDIS